MKKMIELTKKKRKGFTLVEMVIVVTILGVLSSLGFAKFGQVQKSAKKNADYVAASSLATATSLALQDNKDVKHETEENIIDANKLETEGYISTVPKPQSIEGDFKIRFGEDENIYVFVGEEIKDTNVFYPRVKVDENVTQE